MRGLLGSRRFGGRILLLQPAVYTDLSGHLSPFLWGLYRQRLCGSLDVALRADERVEQDGLFEFLRVQNAREQGEQCFGVHVSAMHSASDVWWWLPIKRVTPSTDSRAPRAASETRGTRPDADT